MLTRRSGRLFVYRPKLGSAVQVPHDPDGNAWRRAIRATVVVTLFGIAVAAGSDVVAVYVLFGAFTMLVFDYGGPTHHRIAAYAATTLGGLVLIVVGTAVSQSYVAAAIVASFVAFALTLGAAIGPAVAQLRTPLVLAFVLPASVPAPFHDVDDRLFGWTLGGLAIHDGHHHDAFALVWLGHWLRDLEQAADDLAAPGAELAH